MSGFPTFLLENKTPHSVSKSSFCRIEFQRLLRAEPMGWDVRPRNLCCSGERLMSFCARKNSGRTFGIGIGIEVEIALGGREVP